jgi:type II secretory pathway pseudopilin PulG
MYRHSEMSGITLIELLAVTAISILVAAVGLPVVTRTVSDAKLRAAVNVLRASIRDTRTQAVTDDIVYGANLLQIDGGVVVRVDRAAASDTGAYLDDITIVPEASWPAPLPLDFTPIQTSSMTFNPRGIPCVRVGPSCRTSVNGQVVGFATGLHQRGAMGDEMWAAVTVAPSGSIRVWNWTTEGWRAGD